MAYSTISAPSFRSMRGVAEGNGSSKTEHSYACDLYRDGVRKREPVLQRARLCSLLTDTAVMPYLRGEENLYLGRIATGYGARLVHNFASRVTNMVDPLNDSFFRYEADPMQAIALTGNPRAEGMWNAQLKLLERKTVQFHEEMKLRPTLYENVLNQIVAGPVTLIFEPEKKRARNVPADQFVYERDCAGNVLCYSMCEKIAYRALEPKAQEVVERQLWETHRRKPFDKEEFELYTAFERVGKDRFVYWQEIEKAELPGTSEKSMAELPFILPRIRYVAGETYPRSYTEHYIPDLIDCHRYAKALREGTLAAARFLVFVDPSAQVSPRRVRDARNGEVMIGNGDGVKTFQSQKQIDLAVGREAYMSLREELGYAYLLTSAILRSQGERVTAEEQRYRMEEGDMATGGVLSTEAVEVQMPILQKTIAAIQANRNTRVMVNEDLVIPKIITGINALGGSAQLDRIAIGSRVAGSIVGPEALSMYHDKAATIRESYLAAGVDPNKIVRTEEEVQAEIKDGQKAQLFAETLKNTIPQLARNGAQPAAAPVP